MSKNFSSFAEAIKFSLKNISEKDLDKMIKEILFVKKKKGRIFFIGVGGSAANSSHAVNDFRKLCEIESYSLTDNVSELTARTNDEGWQSAFIDSLKVSNLNNNDALFVLSVGGGNLKKNVSPNIVRAVKYAKEKKVRILGIVGNNGGFTYRNGTAVLKIQCIDKKLITPISETFQSLILHYLVSHPLLQVKKTKW